MNCLLLKLNFPLLYILWFVFAMLILLVSMHCAFPGGEINLFFFKIKPPFLVSFVL